MEGDDAVASRTLSTLLATTKRLLLTERIKPCVAGPFAGLNVRIYKDIEIICITFSHAIYSSVIGKTHASSSLVVTQSVLRA